MWTKHLNRREFVGTSLAGISAFGWGLFSPERLQADPHPVLARIQETPDGHVLRSAFKAAEESLNALEAIKDYTAVFQKKELVGRKLVETRMTLKLREEPFSVYLKFLEPYSGREVLYSKDKHNNQLLVKDVGLASLAGTVTLDPHGSYAMDGNRYPVTNIGIRSMVIKLMENWLNEANLDGLAVLETRHVPLGTLKCHVVDVTHRHRHPGSKYQATRLYVDEATGYPVRVQGYEFSSRHENLGQLAEDYFYTNLRTNVGLTDMDFSTKNPHYRF